MYNKITNKIDQNERLIQIQDWIIDQLPNINLNENMKNFTRIEILNNISSPSNLRIEIFEKTIEK
jgi:hypothetical protein